MAFGHGKNTRILWREYELSGYSRETSVSYQSDVADATVFGASVKSYLPGQRDARATVSGLFHETPDDKLSDYLASETDAPLTIGNQGFAIGKRVQMVNVHEVNYQVQASVGDVVSWSAEFQGTEFARNGVSLHDPSTARSTSSNSTTVDQTASSSAGGLGFLHVITNSRDAVVDIDIEHSTNDSVWASLISFTQVPIATLTSEAIEVSGTVNRYIRVAWALSAGTGSVYFGAAFARY